MKLHNPLPESLDITCKKAASILDHFCKGDTKLDQALIPSKVLERARGIAIMTVVKAGVLWSGRLGTGLVVARLPDGQWSAPSAICMGGVGIGAQFGAQITDCIFILNNDDAVRAFSHGNVTLGGNISVAAGPTGRSAESGGSVLHPAPIYSYSKSKGLFAGITFEGTCIMPRKRTNEQLYGKNTSPRDILFGKIPPPAQADPLYRMLNLKFGKLGMTVQQDFVQQDTDERVSETTITGRGSLPPPLPVKKPTIKKAVALFDFVAQQPGDLNFRKGDIIYVSKCDDNGWWKGSLNGIQGDFPGNYVELTE
ncbi:hypothetical protein EDD86DRAFT_214593 [Gorgonomyces haynaldii]|nr:hypothetical protein EDD86DRAFT_214593 [Gorgonomyces haynaldii]